MKYVLWTIQVLLALLFIFSGVMKFVIPVETMTKDMPMFSGLFVHFIGVCEILGGLGLVLPGLFRIKTWLTPLAASCLVVIMIGAVVITFRLGGIPKAVVPFVTGLLLVFVAYGRGRLVPHRGS
jgi:uncharacterized membrane protein YphA (DoxX/SURF4 family)